MAFTTYLILSILLLFVAWQSVKCFVKYLNDESTIIIQNQHIWDLEDEKLPALTICPESKHLYNETKLMEYGIHDQV